MGIQFMKNREIAYYVFLLLGGLTSIAGFAIWIFRFYNGVTQPVITAFIGAAVVIGIGFFLSDKKIQYIAAIPAVLFFLYYAFIC